MSPMNMAHQVTFEVSVILYTTCIHTSKSLKRKIHESLIRHILDLYPEANDPPPFARYQI